MERQKKETEFPGMPSLEGIRQIKASRFRKFVPDTGWTAWLLVYIFRESGEIDRFEMTEAQFREFQEAREALIPEWRPPDAA